MSDPRDMQLIRAFTLAGGIGLAAWGFGAQPAAVVGLAIAAFAAAAIWWSKP